MINKADLCDLCGLASTTVRDWIQNNTIVPMVPGRKGKGNTAKFTFEQALGVMIAAEIYQGEQGCGPSYVAKVVEAFESVTYDWLQSEFKQGHTHLVMLHQGNPILRANQFNSWPDVKAAFDKLAAKWYEVNTTENEKTIDSFSEQLATMK